MKHHNKHFIGALSMIVLIIVGVGLSLHYDGNLIGFSAVTGMETAPQSSINIPPNPSYTETSGAFTLYVYPSVVEFGGKKGQVFVTTTVGGIIKSVDGAYIPIKDAQENTYLATTTDGKSEYYALNDGTRYVDGGTVTATFEGETLGLYPYLQQVEGKSSILFKEMLTSIQNNLPTGIPTSEIYTSNLVAYTLAHDREITAFAESMQGTEIGKPAIINEETAVNQYISTNIVNSQNSPYYNVVTGKYSGKINNYLIGWSGNTMLVGVTTGTDDSATTTYYLKEKKGSKTTYYTCSNIDCADKTAVSGKDEIAKAKEKYKEGEEAYEDLEDNVQNAMEKGQIKDASGNPITSSVRQQAYMNQLYEEQEQKFKGLVTGYLSKWLDKWLGGWSRGVPAGICKYIFGLDYYKNAGWMAMPGNTSATQLQSTIISQSSTIIIEGEKEEITDTLYRYAYTMRILSNQSLEWTTYLYNSCNQKDSTELFYDYGALGAGDYYAMHYAGAGSQDMIFDCAIEQCLYDQACVALSGSSVPVCVSLVNGAGFETPTAGSDYDCAVTG